jgi:hypothetical protein
VNGSSFIKEIGRSYIVSSFLPAALFVSLGVFIFRGFAPELISEGIQRINLFLGLNKPENFSLGGLFTLFIATCWLAFYLYSSTNWTVQLYEGYKFPRFVSELMRFYFRQRLHRKSLEIYEARRRQFKKRQRAHGRNLKEPRELALVEIENVGTYSPIDEADLLPTRLGNVLKASECYAEERYKLNSLVVFPKLLHVFPQHFINELEDKNNRFIFLIHSSFLAYLIGIPALLVGLFNNLFAPFCNNAFTPKWIINTFCQNGFISRGFSVLSPDEYIVVGLVFVGSGYLLYRVGVDAAREFALHIRAGFDLYRFDLLRQLNHRLPTTLNDEKKIWELLSEYFVAGNRLRFSEIRIRYRYHQNSKSDQSKK